MEVQYSIDGERLEAVLLRAIAERPAAGLRDPILILVPSRRLAAHLKRRIAAAIPAALGVHLLTHRALARRAIERALEPPPRLLPEAALAEVVDAVAAGYGGAGAAHLLEHPGARRALLAAFKDLRDAGIEPGEIGAAGAGAPVMELYPRYAEALERLAGGGLADEAGLIRAAIPHIGRFLEGKGIRRAFHHGAYELIGVHLELLRAVAHSVPVACLLPGEIDGPAFATARRFARRLEEPGGKAGSAAAAIDGSGGSAADGSQARGRWIERLRRLHDPEALWEEPILAPALEIRHSQGPEAELRAAGLRVLALHHRDGIPLHEIAIVARSLASYAPFLEETFSELGLPFTSSAAGPLGRRPRAAAFLRLLRVLARDFERGAVIDLLRSDRLRIADLPVESPDADRWDRWSRAARIDRGLETWLELPAILESIDRAAGYEDEAAGAAAAGRRPSLAALGRILAALDEDRRAWRRAGALDEHGRFLRRLLADRVPFDAKRDGDGPDPLEDALSALELAGRCRAAAGAGSGPIDPAAVEDRLRAIADLEAVPIRAADRGGIHVLDLMQARGTSYRVVAWIGFQHDLFPRRPRASPYLDDAAREAISRATGKPLYPRLDAAAEERLLLAMTLASARERLIISYQRADDAGRRKARSSALRELARVFAGRPDAAWLLRDDPENPFRPERFPAHPVQRAEAAALSPALGLCPFGDALAARAAGAPGGPAAAAAFLDAGSLGGPEEQAARAALGAVECLERHDLSDRRFDGWTGIGLDASFIFSPTAFERLLRCPLAFFLRDVLGVRELDEEAVPHRVEKAALGIAVHETLADVYGRLVKDHQFPLREADLPEARESARAHLEQIWSENLRRAAGPSFRRLRGLYSILEESWRRHLEEFLARDLEEMAANRAAPLDLESGIEAVLRLPGKLALPLRGRIDRILGSGKLLWIDDYKTGGNLESKTSPAGVLKGNHIQLPLYRELAAASRKSDWSAVRARLLGIGPDAEPAAAELTDKEPVREGFLETVAVGLALARKGRFPLDSNSEMCGYCGYRKTCRKTHEPTLTRIENDRALDDFRDIRRKNSKGMNTLEAVRAAAEDTGSAEGGEQ